MLRRYTTPILSKIFAELPAKARAARAQALERPSNGVGSNAPSDDERAARTSLL